VAGTSENRKAGSASTPHLESKEHRLVRLAYDNCILPGIVLRVSVVRVVHRGSVPARRVAYAGRTRDMINEGGSTAPVSIHCRGCRLTGPT
jgi:hypothetical protein